VPAHRVRDAHRHQRNIPAIAFRNSEALIRHPGSNHVSAQALILKNHAQTDRARAGIRDMSVRLSSSMMPWPTSHASPTASTRRKAGTGIRSVNLGMTRRT
jgi:hypothetical protein